LFRSDAVAHAEAAVDELRQQADHAQQDEGLHRVGSLPDFFYLFGRNRRRAPPLLPRGRRVSVRLCGYRGDRGTRRAGARWSTCEVRLTTVKADIPAHQGIRRNGLNQSVSRGETRRYPDGQALGGSGGDPERLPGAAGGRGIPLPAGSRTARCADRPGPRTDARKWSTTLASIEAVHAREILDSRGNPTVEVEVELDD